MSAAAAAKDAAPAAAADAAPAPVPLGKKKKLMMMIAAALVVVLAAGGGTAFYLIKKRAAASTEAEATEEGESKEQAKAAEEQTKAELKHAPAFVPLDPFTVNLADREAERYAQVGMTLELADPKAADLLKAYMPAIRNNILLVLSNKTAGQLMEHQGKVLLAAEVRAAALKPLGWKVRVPALSASGVLLPLKPTEDEDEAPIRAVYFSNFIIQ